MTIYSIEKLSGSTDGKGVKVTGTTSGGAVTVHTQSGAATDIDLITLWAVAQDADGESRTLHLGWGGTTDPDNIITTPLICKLGLTPLVERMPLLNGLVVSAWADEANDVIIYGRVERVDK